MRKQKMLTRPLAALLALVMALTMTPVAAASEERWAPCPTCTSSNCVMTVVKEANCHEKGVERYVCRNAACTMVGRAQLIETNINTGNHDFI